MSETRWNMWRFEVPLGALGAVLVMLSFVFAATGIPRWIPPAMLVRFGVASPLTGMTRSFVAMARGDVPVALGWHPLGPACFVACVFAAVYAVVSMWRGSRVRWIAPVVASRVFGVGIGVAFALSWVRQIREVGIG